MEVLLQQIINGLVLGSMYALIALGYTMVYGSSVRFISRRQVAMPMLMRVPEDSWVSTI